MKGGRGEKTLIARRARQYCYIVNTKRQLIGTTELGFQAIIRVRRSFGWRYYLPSTQIHSVAANVHQRYAFYVKINIRALATNNGPPDRLSRNGRKKIGEKKNSRKLRKYSP